VPHQPATIAVTAGARSNNRAMPRTTRRPRHRPTSGRGATSSPSACPASSPRPSSPRASSPPSSSPPSQVWRSTRYTGLALAGSNPPRASLRVNTSGKCQGTDAARSVSVRGRQLGPGGPRSRRLPPMTDGPAIDVRGLTKHYRATVAVDDLTFSVPRGSVTGFLGPNGAGKDEHVAGPARPGGAHAGTDVRPRGSLRRARRPAPARRRLPRGDGVPPPLLGEPEVLGSTSRRTGSIRPASRGSGPSFAASWRTGAPS
jgi:hypothetical protein